MLDVIGSTLNAEDFPLHYNTENVWSLSNACIVSGADLFDYCRDQPAEGSVSPTMFHHSSPGFYMFPNQF